MGIRVPERQKVKSIIYFQTAAKEEQSTTKTSERIPRRPRKCPVRNWTRRRKLAQ